MAVQKILQQREFKKFNILQQREFKKFNNLKHKPKSAIQPTT